MDEVRVLDGGALRSAEARRLAALTPALREVYSEPAMLVRKEREQPIFAPSDLLDAVMKEGEKGLTLQRYKGLGEMNPEQLWETTMDPQNRVLRHVEIDDAMLADEYFGILMGDKVEPRREFIETHAHEVRNLDV